jgi:phage head maturation protease
MPRGFWSAPEFNGGGTCLGEKYGKIARRQALDMSIQHTIFEYSAQHVGLCCGYGNQNALYAGRHWRLLNFLNPEGGSIMADSHQKLIRTRLKDGTLAWLTGHELMAEHKAGDVAAVFSMSIFPVPTQRSTSDDRRASAVITSLSVDRAGSIVDPAGIDFRSYIANPVVLLNHNQDMPIGRTEKLIRPSTKDKIIATWNFAPGDISPIAEWAWRMWKEGYLNATSIGFLPLKILSAEELDGQYAGLEFTDVVFVEAELIEFSVVTLPMNRDALRLDEEKKYWSAVVRRSCDGPKSVWGELIKASLGEGPNMAKQQQPTDEVIRIEPPRLLVKRGVISYEEAHPEGTPKAPEDEPWDGPAEVAQADVEDLKIMCAWYDSDYPDLKGSYKLPHHRATGRHAVVWRGVVAAMASLLGARTPLDVPDEDRPGIYTHLVKHYGEFDRPPPEFKRYSGKELVELFPELYPEKTFSEIKLAWAAGTLSAEEALALIERVIVQCNSALEEAKQEAEYWKHELAKLAARILLTYARCSQHDQPK